MPGYVMHLAQAQMVINELKQYTELSDAWVQAFKTGSLIPDTRLFHDKVISHFWDPAEHENLERAPKLSFFLDKYGDRLEDPLLLGYLLHLDLDRHYVENYWPLIISFYNEEGEREKLKKKIVNVKIHRTGEIVPLDTFFSPDYYYGDYTRLNDYFLGKYGLTDPKWQQVTHFVMDEVRLEDMEIIIKHLTALLKEYREGEIQPTRVFDREHLESFMTAVTRDFVQEYKACFPGLKQM